MNAPPPVSPLEALKAGFRRACIRRLVNDEKGAIEVLKNEIPRLVMAWAKGNSLEPAEKKSKLKEMFDDESSRANELACAFDLFAGRFEARVAEIVRRDLQSISLSLGSAVRDLRESMEKIRKFSEVLEGGDSFSSPKNPSDVQTPEPSDAQGRKSAEEKDEGDSPLPRQSDLSEESNECLSQSSVPSETRSNRSAAPPMVQDLQDDPVSNLNQLDPPSGTGLRFDEIEEMIDEILSYESS